jgi:ferrochelatase
MTYGEPSIKHVMRGLEAEGLERFIIFPMYPQFSSTTTGSVYDAAYEAAAGRPGERKRYIPSLRFVPPYYEHPSYIAALKAQIQSSVLAWGQEPEQYVFTFHGIPQRYARTGDPYPQHCQKTAQLLAQALHLSEGAWQMTYQSRFGPEAWLQPYTDETIEHLAQRGIRRVALACPGFVADCLETVDEIGHEGLNQFVEAGGPAEGYHLAPCLNDNPWWLDAMAELVLNEAAGCL